MPYICRATPNSRRKTLWKNDVNVCFQSLTLCSHSLTVESEDPEFTDVIDNITVPAGRSIKLACSVKNLGSYKVSTAPSIC